MAVNNNRIRWIDELKGAILVFICLGHIAGMVYTPPSVKYIADLLTIIGVPIFFFLSGMLFKNKETSTKAYLQKKTKSLLIPYILLSILFTFFDPYIYNPTYLVNVLHYPRLVLPELLSINPHIQASLEFFIGDICCTLLGISSRATLPLWFVFVLYFVTIAYHWIFIKTKSQKVMAIIAILCAAMAFVLSYVGMVGHMKAGPILMAFFFYWLGTVFIRRFKWLEKIKFLHFVVVIVSLLCILFYLAPTIMKGIYFVNGNFPITKSFPFLVCSFAGIISGVLLFRSLSPISSCGLGIIKGVLRNIARNSLIILATHYWALVFYHLFLSPIVPLTYQLFSAIIFIVLICILSVVLFRTHLYMFIGGTKSKQSMLECLSIK